MTGASEKSSLAWHLPTLFLLCSMLFFFPIQDLPFFNKGEAREAVVVQTMVNEGNWLFPLRSNGRLPSKPPLFHWMGGLTSVAYGQTTEATVRFPSALLATFGVFLVYALGRIVFGADCGFWGAVILATSLDYQFLGVAARVDMTMTFFVTLSLVLFYFLDSGYLSRPLWRAILYAIMGLGVLAKGPISVVLVVSVIGLFYALDRRWSELRGFLFHRMMFLTVVFVVLWYGFAVVKGGEDFFQKQILHENLLRFWALSDEGTGHKKPFYYYFPYLLMNGLPWTLFLPFVVVDGFRHRKLPDRGVRFLVFWVVAIFLFLSLSAGKRPDYLLPLYPALALLISHWLATHVRPGSENFPGVSVMGGLFLLVAAIALVLLWDTMTGPGFRLLDLFTAQLRPQDRQEVLWVARAIAERSGVVSVIFFLFACVSLFLGHALLKGRLQAVRASVFLLAILVLTLGQFICFQAIAANKSYASFVVEVKRARERGGNLYIYRGGFDKYQLIFYQGGDIPVLRESPAQLVERLRSEDDLVILTETEWRRVMRMDAAIARPIVKSAGTGPDGDTPLVLIRGLRTAEGKTWAETSERRANTARETSQLPVLDD